MLFFDVPWMRLLTVAPPHSQSSFISTLNFPSQRRSNNKEGSADTHSHTQARDELCETAEENPIGEGSMTGCCLVQLKNDSFPIKTIFFQ